MNQFTIGDGSYCNRCGQYYIGYHTCWYPYYPYLNQPQINWGYTFKECSHCYCQEGKENHKKCCKCQNELHKDFIGLLTGG